MSAPVVVHMHGHARQPESDSHVPGRAPPPPSANTSTHNESHPKNVGADVPITEGVDTMTGECLPRDTGPPSREGQESGDQLYTSTPLMSL